MTGRIIVAGDVHLGSEHANSDAFDRFLDDLGEDNDLQELVLLGDVWDLVRRDPFGCAWETSGTIVRLQRLAEDVPIRFVLGNHDTYLSALDGSLYDIEFTDDCVLEQGTQRIRCVHGNAFDRFQFDRLSTYLSGPGDRGEIDPTNGQKDPVVAGVREIVQRGTERLRSTPPFDQFLAADAAAYARRERRAHAYLETIPEDKLLYGHTHAPYVHHENIAANPGSWKATAPRHNTYLALVDGTIDLYQYRPSGDDERLTSHGRSFL